MNKEIKTKNNKGKIHGYRESYHLTKISYRSIYKNNQHVGYSEWHGIEETIFYIR